MERVEENTMEPPPGPQRVEENSHHQASTSEGGFGEGRGVFWLGVDPERGGGLAQLQPSAEPICIPDGP